MNRAIQVLRRCLGEEVFLFVVIVFFLCSGPMAQAERLTLNFNPDWKFIQADPTNATAVGLDDRDWTNVSAPHTYNDTDTFDDWSLSGHRGEQNQWGGRTWYRKTFTLPKSFKGKKVFVEFEAVRQVAEVYLNRKFLGVCKTGFTPFGFDLTPHLRFNVPNVLAVMCDNRFMKDPWEADGLAQSARTTGTNGQLNIGARPGSKLSELAEKFNAEIPEEMDRLRADQIPWNNPHWHPAHGGIYRNVYLHVTDPLHISLPLYSFLQTTGPYAYAADISDRSATVNLQVPIQNGRASAEKVEIVAKVLNRDGKAVATLKPTPATQERGGEIAVAGSASWDFSGTIGQPQYWSPAQPYLYRVICELRAGGKTVDTVAIPLGIRTMRWDVVTGFYLNGQHLKLRGWGQKPTDEWPGLGAAVPDWMHFLTLEMMKSAGGNFVRWGHCLGGPASIEAADRLGLITLQPGVDGESDTRGAAWTLRASTFRDTLVYFRNHPSILVWEGGNQKVSREHAEELHALVEQYDPHGGRAYTHRRADKITAELMDIGVGTEGGREIASLPVVEGEYNREESPRRVWDGVSPPNFGYPEGKGQTYDLTSEVFAVNQVAHYVRKLGAPEHSGGANWIFSDSTSGGRVACEVARTSGEVDAMRLPKEAYYACRAMFRADPQAHIIGHWTYPAGTRKNVYVVANSEEVELFVNGKSLGRGKNSDRYLFTFSNVTWEAGEIKAVARVGGKIIATQAKQTVGKPAVLRITSITGPGGFRADGSDVALFDVEAVDARGQRCPTFQQRVDFELDGPAVWRGGYNSGRTNSINHSYLDLEGGINRVAVRATRTSGNIALRARTDGLRPASVTLRSGNFELANSFSTPLPASPKVVRRKDGFGLAAADSMPPAQFVSRIQSTLTTGRFMKAFSYSGPTASVRLEIDAQAGRRVYLDRDFKFVKLPEALRGSDYVQAANDDKLYNAVDLMEVAVRSGRMVSVAHDDGLPRPAWLTRQFVSSEMTLTVDGRPMRVFQRRAENDESLTLGANTEDAKSKSCNMYVVFVGAASGERADRNGVPNH